MSQDVLQVTTEGAVATLTLNRPEKRNAMSDALLERIDAFFRRPPEGVRVAVLAGSGGHFCAGLDLAEHRERSAEAALHHSGHWQSVMNRIQLGGLPVVSALSGAVVGGGLELAVATHVRVCDPTAVFQLPEGRRGIFVGGGGSVRVGRIIGADRMVEMMLTGRKLTAVEACSLGLAHYFVEAGGAMARARELAGTIAGNARLSNHLVIQALTRIGDMPSEGGFLTESLATALSQTSPDAAEGLAAFLEKREARFR